MIIFQKYSGQGCVQNPTFERLICRPVSCQENYYYYYYIIIIIIVIIIIIIIITITIITT